MGEHSSENYLDELLNSINDEDENSLKKEVRKEEDPKEAFARELFGDLDSDEAVTAKNEEDFLREFEAELLKDDIPNYMENFEQDLSAVSMPEEEPAVDENVDFEGEFPEVEMNSDEEADHLENLAQAVDDFDEKTLPQTEEGEPDLAGIGEKNLMDMLLEDQSLSDLGDMLSGDEAGKPLEEGDSIGEFAEAEMEAQAGEVEEAENPEESSTDGKKKKGKKKDKKENKENKETKKDGGFFSKITKLLFGEEEEELQPIGFQDSGEEAIALSEENQKILEELEAAGEGKASGKKKKKEKEPKPKKEKKAKEAKPKKEKKPKAPKKEKKPKEKDTTPPLPKKPVIAIVVMVASLFGLVLLVTNLLGYQANMNAAKENYQKGAYVEAYRNLQGLKMKEKDEAFYTKLSVLAAVSEKYQAYLVFDNRGDKDLAFDSLVCAYGRCDVNRKYADEYDCEKELEEMSGKILKILLKEYDMTGEEALELYQIKNRDEYTVELLKKLKELGIE